MLTRDHPTRARRNIAGYTLQAGKRTPATDQLGTSAILALVEKPNPYREDSPKRASDCAVGSLRPYRWSTPLPAAARAPREAQLHHAAGEDSGNSQPSGSGCELPWGAAARSRRFLLSRCACRRTRDA